MKRLVALAMAALWACGPADAPGPAALELRFSFDGDTCTFCSSIDDCPLACSGEIGLFLVDADTDEVLDRFCREFAGNTQMVLRKLPDLLVDANLEDGLELGRRVALELAIFSPRSVEGGCPRVRAEFVPPTTDAGEAPTYFGRSEPTRIGTGALTATLPLACVVDQAECSTTPDSATITAHVTDLASGQRPPTRFRDLDVRAGHLIDGAPGRYAFAVDRVLVLQELSGREPTWRATIAQPDFQPFCYGTLVTEIGATQAFPIVSCTGEESIDSRTGLPRLDTQASFVDAALIETMLDKLGLSEGLPATGLLIGRVNAGGQPVAGAVVQPFTGSAQVVYLGEDLAPTSDAFTSASGWFVIVTPPQLGLAGEAFGEYFQASIGGLVGCSQGPLGLVDGKIVAGPIDLFDECGSQP